MKNLLTIILTTAAITFAAIFNWHGEPTKAKAAGGGDGMKIVYTCFTGNSSNGQRNLCVMNADGSGKYQIPDPNNIIRDAFSPRFDADAEKILFLSRVVISQGVFRYRLGIVNADGANPSLLFDGLQYDANDYSVNAAGFSPDGSKIAFITYPRNGNVYNQVLWIMNRDGSGLTQLYAGNIHSGFPFNTNGIQQSLGLQYISFSPDGRHLVVPISQAAGFDDYEICRVNTDGSGMTPLTDLSRFLVDPVYSPDGSKIVFIEALNEGFYRLTVMDAGGTNHIVLTPDQTKNFQPSFSPDGNKIIFNSSRNSAIPSDFSGYDIYSINTDGTNETRLTFNSDPGMSGLASFDPLGEKIVFNSTPLGGFQDMEVFSMNPNGTSVTVLTDSPGEENAGNPSYGNSDLDGDGVKNTLDNCRLVSNPNQTNTDGDAQGNACDADDDNDDVDDGFDNCPLAVNFYRVAFSTGLDIWTMNENNSDLRRLTFGTTFDEEPSFNNAGSRIVFHSNQSNSRNEIYAMNSDGTGQTRLTNIAGNNRSPVYSPDGSKIAFISSRARPGGGNSPGLYIMNSDGTNQINLATNWLSFDDADPTFNHDGTRIAYYSGRDLGNLKQDIYAINPDGTGETRLTTATGVDNQPAYSPDGSKIVFISFRGGNTNGEIYVMNADGTNQTRITNNTLKERQPTFTPDGTKITFTDFTDADLWRINVDGTGLIRLTNGASFPYTHPSYTAQPDADGDGAGDACDDFFNGDAQFDFDGDGKSDVSVWRPSNGMWYLQQTTAGFAGIGFGQAGDKITPADYDGDGRADIAVYRGGTWYLQRSQLGFTAVAFGTPTDVPAPADYDGDGKAELAVFRPSSGVWYLYNLATNQNSLYAFGQNGDVPVAADYDGDAKADVAVFRPSTGIWYLQRSQLGFAGVTFGQFGDKAVPADYDGDAKADVAVFRGGMWYLLRSSLGFTAVSFGTPTDLPAPADYDGDAKADVSVFRPSSGTWYLQKSTSGFTNVVFGTTDDVPAPAAYIP